MNAIQIFRQAMLAQQTRAILTKAYGVEWVRTKRPACTQAMRDALAASIRKYRNGLPGRVTATGQHINPYDGGNFCCQ
jgi:hypothetical protein